MNPRERFVQDLKDALEWNGATVSVRDDILGSAFAVQYEEPEGRMRYVVKKAVEFRDVDHFMVLEPGPFINGLVDELKGAIQTARKYALRLKPGRPRREEAMDDTEVEMGNAGDEVKDPCSRLINIIKEARLEAIAIKVSGPASEGRRIALVMTKLEEALLWAHSPEILR